MLSESFTVLDEDVRQSGAHSNRNAKIFCAPTVTHLCACCPGSHTRLYANRRHCVGQAGGAISIGAGRIARVRGAELKTWYTGVDDESVDSRAWHGTERPSSVVRRHARFELTVHTGPEDGITLRIRGKRALSQP